MMYVEGIFFEMKLLPVALVATSRFNSHSSIFPSQLGLWSFQSSLLPRYPREMSTSLASAQSTDPEQSAKNCVPCSGLDSSAVLPLEQVQSHLQSTLPLWTLRQITGQDAPPNAQKLSRSFVAKSFQAALDAINAMGTIAEEENHHPDFHLTNYREVQIDLFTHKLNGITQNDLVLAEKLDQVSILYSPKWLKAHPEADSSSKAST